MTAPIVGHAVKPNARAKSVKKMTKGVDKNTTKKVIKQTPKDMYQKAGDVVNNMISHLNLNSRDAVNVESPRQRSSVVHEYHGFISRCINGMAPVIIYSLIVKDADQRTDHLLQRALKNIAERLKKEFYDTLPEFLLENAPKVIWSYSITRVADVKEVTLKQLEKGEY